MVQLDKDLLTWIKEKFFLKTEIESLLSNKSDTGHTHQSDTSLSTESMNPVANKVITNELNTKAPENHASTATKYGVATDTKYGHVKVDTALNTTSTSPVENRKIKTALDDKADSIHSHSSLSSTIISSNQDLNNYKTPGEYYCDSNSVAATLYNCPVTIAFHLSIIQHAGIRQILKTYATNNVRTYERNFYKNTWSIWYLTYTTETLNTDNGLMSTTEKNKLSRIADEATKNIVDTSLNTSSNNAISNKAVTTGLNGKAPTNHASTGTSYGLGSTNNYGHCKTINSLTQSSHADGTALSAYQGKILKDLIDTKSSGDHTHTGSTLRLGSSGSDANITIQDAVNGKSTLIHTHNLNDVGLTKIGANADFETYKQQGFYYIDYNDAQSCDNMPFRTGGLLIVRNLGGGVSQTFQRYTGIDICYRTYYNGSWSDWKKISFEGHTHTISQITNFPTSMTPTSHTHQLNDVGLTKIGDHADFETYKQQGFYYIDYNDAQSCDNMPFRTGGLLIVRNLGGGVSQTFQRYTGIDICYRTYYNGSWSDWKKISFEGHTHGNIQSGGTIGSDANKPLITTTSGKITTGSFGNGPNTFCEGNDSRITNAVKSACKIGFGTSSSAPGDAMNLSVAKGNPLYAFVRDANGNVPTGLAGGAFLFNGSPRSVTINSNGIMSLTMSTAGTFVIHAIVSDGDGYQVAAGFCRITVS